MLMKLKVPPAVIFLVFGLLMYGVANVLPFGEFDFFGRKILLKILLALAVIIALIALLQFFFSGITANPGTPGKTKKLVTNGIYQFSRNPMYLALLLLLLGWGLWLGNAFNTLVAAGFVYYMNAFQIKPEEESLLKIFGTEYKQYCILVRRWF